MTLNTGDRKSVRAAEKAARIADNLRGAYVRDAMSSIEGRMWFNDLLVRCKLFHNPMSDSDRWTAFACGEMNIGQQVLADIMAYCPDQYVLMQREANDRIHARINTGPGSDNSPGSEQPGREDIERGTQAGSVNYDYAPETTPPATTEQAKTPEPAKSETLAEGKKPEDAKPVVPEKYEFKAPEGYQFDAKLVEEVAPVFKELGLTNEQAQKLMDIQAKREIGLAKAPQDAYNDMRGGWRNATLADTTIAANGALRTEVSAGISKAIDSLGPETSAEFRKVMDISGVGDNPAFVKAIYQFSKSLTEGRPVKGSGPSPHGQSGTQQKPTTAASGMWPHLPN